MTTSVIFFLFHALSMHK